MTSEYHGNLVVASPGPTNGRNQDRVPWGVGPREFTMSIKPESTGCAYWHRQLLQGTRICQCRYPTVYMRKERGVGRDITWVRGKRASWALDISPEPWGSFLIKRLVVEAMYSELCNS